MPSRRYQPRSNWEEGQPLFSRVLTKPKKVRWPYFVGALIVLPIAAALSMKTDTGAFNVVTARGIKTLRTEMSMDEVHGMLGKPLSSAPREGCYRYGTPKLDAVVTLYRVCYQQGRVTEVTPEKWEVEEVDTTGLEREAQAAPETQGG